MHISSGVNSVSGSKGESKTAKKRAGDSLRLLTALRVVHGVSARAYEPQRLGPTRHIASVITALLIVMT
jgi:hypothetical protein